MSNWNERLKNENLEVVIPQLMAAAEDRDVDALELCMSLSLAQNSYNFPVNRRETLRYGAMLEEEGHDASRAIGLAFNLLGEKEDSYEWLRLAIERGHKDEDTLGVMAVICFDTKRYEEAYQLAMQVDTYQKPLVLGMMYENGYYLPQDDEKAYQYYSEAYRKGFSKAQECMNRVAKGGSNGGGKGTAKIVIAVICVILYFIIRAM